MWCSRVKCEKCKHLIEKKDAQRVSIVSIGGGIHVQIAYYCPEHSKPYDHAQIFTEKMSLSQFWKKEIQVSANGTPIGYQKIKESKNAKIAPTAG